MEIVNKMCHFIAKVKAITRICEVLEFHIFSRSIDNANSLSRSLLVGLTIHVCMFIRMYNVCMCIIADTFLKV